MLKKSIGIVFTVLIVLCCANYSNSKQQEAWEYKTVDFSDGTIKKIALSNGGKDYAAVISRIMNENGIEGWEFCERMCIGNQEDVYGLFKRRK